MGFRFHWPTTTTRTLSGIRYVLISLSYLFTFFNYFVCLTGVCPWFDQRNALGNHRKNYGSLSPRTGVGQLAKTWGHTMTRHWKTYFSHICSLDGLEIYKFPIIARKIARISVHFITIFVIKIVGISLVLVNSICFPIYLWNRNLGLDNASGISSFISLEKMLFIEIHFFKIVLLYYYVNVEQSPPQNYIMQWYIILLKWKYHFFVSFFFPWTLMLCILLTDI